MSNIEEPGEPAGVGRTNPEDSPPVGIKDIHHRRNVAVVRWLSIVLIVAALLVIVRSLPIGHVMEAMKGWIGGLGIWGPVVLVLSYIVATVLFVPGMILTMAGGAMFGLQVGMVTVSIGSTLGASIAFLISRYLARDKVAVMAGRNRRFAAIDQAIDEGGWKIVALVRLSPVTPFSLENYLFGLTRICFWPYVLASWLAMLPGTFLYVYLGHVADVTMGTDRARTSWEWILLAVGLLATAGAMVYLTRLARGKLQEHMGETIADDEASPIPHEEARGAGRDAGGLRRTMILAAVALLMVGAAAMVYVSAGTMERWLTGLVGTPRVKFTEAHSEAVSRPFLDHLSFQSVLSPHLVGSRGELNPGAVPVTASMIGSGPMT